MTKLKTANPSARQRAHKLDLKLVRPDALRWTRKRSGQSFAYFNEMGRRIRDKTVVTRLNALAVPPASVDVNYAADALNPGSSPAKREQILADVVTGRD